MLRLPGDATTGPLSAQVKALTPHPLQVAFQAARATAELGEMDEVPNATILSLASGIANVLGNKDAPTAWFRLLESAAAAFENGRDSSEEEELAAGHALDARVGLEMLNYRAGTDEGLLDILQRIDDGLKDVAGAIMLLDDSEYFGSLGDVEPRADSWWGERAEVAGQVPSWAMDEALEKWGSSVGVVPRPEQADLVANALSAWRQLIEGAVLAVYRLREAFALALAAPPVAATGAVQAPLPTAERMESERGDWRAFLSLPKPGAVRIQFLPTSDGVAPLPAGSWVWFKGLQATLENRDPSRSAVVSFDLQGADERAAAREPPDLAIITPAGAVIAFQPLK